ncbi:MAG: DUF4412 domain-containing protein [Flavobacteriales bacterium]|nr:DUF4412 domain-containing protein [Flavobacteriales bacterium]
MYKSILTFALLLILGAFQAQDNFEGMITFKIEYTQLPAEMAGFESMLPTEMVSYIKGHKSRNEQTTAITGQQVTIVDSETSYTVSLMNLLGNKIALEITPEEAEASKSNESDMKIEYTKEKKEIAGYTCTKVLISFPEMATPLIVYVTKDIKGATQENFGDLEGFPLEYIVAAEGVQARYYAVKVEEKPISDDLFNIPTDYKKMSQTELQQLYGG